MPIPSNINESAFVIVLFCWYHKHGVSSLVPNGNSFIMFFICNWGPQLIHICCLESSILSIKCVICLCNSCDLWYANIDTFLYCLYNVWITRITSLLKGQFNDNKNEFVRNTYAETERWLRFTTFDDRKITLSFFWVCVGGYPIVNNYLNILVWTENVFALITIFRGFACSYSDNIKFVITFNLHVLG